MFCVFGCGDEGLVSEITEQVLSAPQWHRTPHKDITLQVPDNLVYERSTYFDTIEEINVLPSVF